MENNICRECGTENEPEYVYCKNCGALLKRGSEPNESDASHLNTHYSPVGTGAVHAPYVADSIDGIPREELSAFIGQKAFKIMPKLSKMEITRSKVSWCWPAAVLGFLFGPVGAALWFFWRKMHKPAILLAALGAVITLATTFMTLGTSTVDVNNLFSSFAQGDLNGIINSVESEETILSMLASLLDETASLGTGILCGLFGWHIYKNHCTAKIREFRALQTDGRYYSLGLAAIGGTSGGMLTVGILIMLGINYLSSFITVLINN